MAACPVCFGGDADQAGLGRAYNLAIGSMLALTFGLLTAGVLWIRRIERRRREVDRQYLALLDVVDAAPASDRRPAGV